VEREEDAQQKRGRAAHVSGMARGMRRLFTKRAQAALSNRWSGAKGVGGKTVQGNELPSVSKKRKEEGTSLLRTDRKKSPRKKSMATKALQKGLNTSARKPGDKGKIQPRQVADGATGGSRGKGLSMARLGWRIWDQGARRHLGGGESVNNLKEKQVFARKKG